MSFPTRNMNTELGEMAARNATPPPPNPYAENRHHIPPEIVDAMIDRQRQAEKAAAGPRPSSTIGQGAINALDALMHAVEEQRAGGEPDLPTVHAAVAELSRLLALAQQRGLGMPIGVTFSAPPP